jgi:hypothetical protein
MQSKKKTKKTTVFKKTQPQKPKQSARTKASCSRSSALQDAPMDVAEHLRTTALCMNRILKEPGISRMIVGYHKYLLMGDVELRISKLANTLIEMKRVTRRTTDLLTEMASYLPYFCSDELVFGEGFCSALLTIALNNSILGPLIAECVLVDVLVIAARPTNSVKHLFFRLFGTLMYPDDQIQYSFDERQERLLHCADWKSRAIDQLLDHANLLNTLLQFISNDDASYTFLPGTTFVVWFIVKNLHYRPTSRHYARHYSIFREAYRSAVQRRAHRAAA